MPQEPWRFHLSGGRLCFDLANTVSWRASRRPLERLEGPEDLIRWAQQAEVITDQEAGRLVHDVRRSLTRSVKALTRARALREAIYRVFSTLAEGRAPNRTDLARINSELSEALCHLRVTRHMSGRFIWAWERGASSFSRLIWPVARSAAEVLISDDLGRIKRCPSSDCGWIFLDTSRNGTRRWCDMSVCGNRAKVRRHYARLTSMAAAKRGRRK